MISFSNMTINSNHYRISSVKNIRADTIWSNLESEDSINTISSNMGYYKYNSFNRFKSMIRYNSIKMSKAYSDQHSILFRKRK